MKLKQTLGSSLIRIGLIKFTDQHVFANVSDKLSPLKLYS